MASVWACPWAAFLAAPQILHGLVGPLGHGVVIREPVDRLIKAVRVQGLQSPACSLMKGLAARDEQTFVGDLLGQGMGENVHRLGGPGLLIEKLQPGELPQMRVQDAWALPDRPQQAQ